MRTIGRFISFLLGVGWFLFMFLTPILGVWLASSLVSLHGGPRELAVIGGVLLFPVLPVAWELRATSAWNKKVSSRKQLGAPPKRKLTALDRLILRTLFVNLAFLAALLVWFPKTAFTALATRGDWFISERHEPWANDLRKVLFASASGLEWLHELANPNPYKQQGDDTPVPASVTPVEDTRQPVVRRWPVPTSAPDAGVAVVEAPAADAGVVEPVQVATATLNTDATWTVGDTVWPYQRAVHPVVAAMTAADEGSIEAVAKHIASRERDPFLRVKALHDWVVTRLRYDEDSLDDRRRKPQDAQAVFTNRLGVCEGYARLMVELGKHTGDTIVYVVGDVREENGGVASVGHAWNAVEVKGRWYLVDATWDDPIVDGRKVDVYSTDYLFIPPSVAIFDHLPEQERWQLLPRPLSRGDFMRQPFARPGLAREGLALRTPERSSVEVRDTLELALDNPRRLYVSAKLTGNGKDVECGVDNGATVSLRCAVPASGRYEARLFTNRERYGTYSSVAAIDVLSR